MNYLLFFLFIHLVHLDGCVRWPIPVVWQRVVGPRSKLLLPCRFNSSSWRLIDTSAGAVFLLKQWLRRIQNCASITRTITC